MIVKRFSEGGGYYKGTLAILLSDGTVVYLDCGMSLRGVISSQSST